LRDVAGLLEGDVTEAREFRACCEGRATGGSYTVHSSLFILRRVVFAAIAGIVLASPAVPGFAQGMADKIATSAANAFVGKINGESCSQFAATMAKMKGSSASPSPMSAKLKGNAQARTEFVNIVAAPLVNKMIDCNMLPGGS
jgi:hypothetical protein